MPRRCSAWLLGLGALFLLAVGSVALADPVPASQVAPLAEWSAADVEVSKEASPSRVISGNPVTYTIVFQNSSPVTATLAAITDTLDAPLSFSNMVIDSSILTPPVSLAGSLVWTGTLDIAPSGTLTLSYRADTPGDAGWSYPCNSVEATGEGVRVGPAETCITVGPEKAYVFLPNVAKDFEMARLAVAKTVSPGSFIAHPGQIVTYTVTIDNEGDATGTLLTVVDTLPAGFTFQSMAAGSDVSALPDGTTGTITWSGPWNLAPGQEIELVYRVVPSQVPEQHTNEVYVTAQAADVPEEPAVATVTIEPAFLLQESFGAGIGAWTPFLNHHRLEPGQWYYGPHDGYLGSGGLTHDCCTGSEVASDALMMYLQPGAEDWTDYRVETKMYLTGGVDKYGNPEPNTGDPIGLWVRGHYEDSELESQWVSGYYVVLVGNAADPDHFVRIAKMQQPGDCEACEKPYRMYNFDNPMFKARSEDLPGPFEHYRWYELAVEVQGATIRVFVDDLLVLTWTDPTLPFLSGTVGFKVHETKTATFDDIVVVPLP